MLTYRCGDVYSGRWENDLPMGKGSITYSSGEVYIGDWKHGQVRRTCTLEGELCAWCGLLSLDA